MGKKLDTAHLKQPADSQWCFIACVTMVLNAAGQPLSMDEVSKLANAASGGPKDLWPLKNPGDPNQVKGAYWLHAKTKDELKGAGRPIEVAGPPSMADIKQCID